MLTNEKKFVSRGGIKLEKALSQFHLDPRGLTCLDVGSSTGGFVDCLLQMGAEKVYSLDTAYGELAWKLRQDPRVVVIERQNVLFYPGPPERLDLITIDVTFTPLAKILPKLRLWLKPAGVIVALLKPQYEAPDLALRHHGVIPDESQEAVLAESLGRVAAAGFQISASVVSPILGVGGNKEYLLCVLPN